MRDLHAFVTVFVLKTFARVVLHQVNGSQKEVGRGLALCDPTDGNDMIEKMTAADLIQREFYDSQVTTPSNGHRQLAVMRAGDVQHLVNRPDQRLLCANTWACADLIAATSQVWP